MIINMTTLAGRKTPYIDQTLESLFQSDGRGIALNLTVGSFDLSGVEKYRQRANVVAWDWEAQEQTKGTSMRRHCTINAVRAIEYGDDDHCLCCEDDIVFDKSWFKQLMLTVAEIERKEYVLNLGQQCSQSPGKRYAIHERPNLVGAQGIFYPSKEVRKAVAEYIRRHLTKGTNDHLIGKYARQHSVMYDTTPILVEHIGQVSCFH